MTTAYAARVLTIDDDGPTVRVPMLGGGQSWGPLASSVPGLAVDDQVIVMPLGESSDRLHIVARLQGRPTGQGEIPGLVSRLEAIESKNVGQDARLDGAETVNGQQNTRLTNVEGRAGSLETRATSIEGVNTTQNNRLTAVETKNSDQDTRLTNTEAKANAAAVDTAVVHRTGAESVAGVKTFTDQPVIPAPTVGTSPVRADEQRLVRYMCKVKLTGPSTSDINTSGYVTSTVDVWAGNAGASGTGVWSAQYDPYGMFQAGPPCRIVAPLTGIYRCTYRTVYLSSTNTTDTLVAFIAKISASSANTFARDARRCINLGNDGSPLLATNEIDLTAGQAIFWGNWSSVNARISIPGFTLAGTEITVTYLGPSAVLAA